MDSSESLDDFIQAGIDQQDIYRALVERESIKVHKVFRQNPDGEALLIKWTEQLIMIPTVTPDCTQFEAGINEGIKTFIRNIILQVKKTEETSEE